MGKKNARHFTASRLWLNSTKIVIADACHAASALNAKRFLEYLIKQYPVPIKSLQVDGGSEFMKDFEKACQSLKIELFVLPLRTPELNGNVERANKTLRYEFYQFYQGAFTMNAVREALKDYLRLYNHFRPHQALQQATPIEYYRKHYLEVA